MSLYIFLKAKIQEFIKSFQLTERVRLNRKLRTQINQQLHACKDYDHDLADELTIKIDQTKEDLKNLKD